MLPPHATLQQTRSFLTHELRKDYPETEAESMTGLVLEHLGYPPSKIIMDPSLRPGPEILAQIKEIVAEIHTGKPIQYILGYSYFYDLKISVDKRVLIPRPETEEMVAQIISAGKDHFPFRIMDLGTGSGCIALALKKQYPEAEVFALDVSSGALEVAAGNGDALQLKVQWFRGDMTQPDSWEIPGSFDLVVSNPPYVRWCEQKEMQRNVLDFEPPGALFVPDSDPLLFYRAIATLGRERITEKGTVWVEINEMLGKETARLFSEAGYHQVTIIKDIHEKDRFIRASK
jgi:release factor glutamine methyltransferase